LQFKEYKVLRSQLKMRQIQLSVLISMLFIISCYTENKKDVITENQSKPFPVVIDTVRIGKFLNLTEDYTPTWLSTSNYNLFYIGEKKDTIYLSKSIYLISTPPPPPVYSPSTKNKKSTKTEPINKFKGYFIDWDKENNFRSWTQCKVNIEFDTSNKVANFFPLMITNPNKDTITIGYDRHIPLKIEAIDSNGKWKPIQQIHKNMCGVGVNSIILPPNECLITLAPTFKGNYKTKMRFIIGKNQSKHFYGSINYSQFKILY